jgi:hypothetical protein
MLTQISTIFIGGTWSIDNFLSTLLFSSDFTSFLSNSKTKKKQNKILDQNKYFKNFEINHIFFVCFTLEVFCLLILSFLLQLQTLSHGIRLQND